MFIFMVCKTLRICQNRETPQNFKGFCPFHHFELRLWYCERCIKNGESSAFHFCLKQPPQLLYLSQKQSISNLGNSNKHSSLNSKYPDFNDLQNQIICVSTCQAFTVIVYSLKNCISSSFSGLFYNKLKENQFCQPISSNGHKFKVFYMDKCVYQCHLNEPNANELFRIEVIKIDYVFGLQFFYKSGRVLLYRFDFE